MILIYVFIIIKKKTIDDEAFLNAKLAISIARKLGATIFLVPEDIVSLKFLFK